MPTKRCKICQKPAKIDDLDLTCAHCHESELDLLMKVYGYLHCSGNDFIAATEVMRTVGSHRGIDATQVFMKNWILKGWLEANELHSVRVPESLQEELEISGFDAHSAAVRDALAKKKAEGPRKEIRMDMSQPEQDEKTARIGMVYSERRRGS